MSVLKILKRLVVDTSVYFTIITAIYSAIHLLINTSEEEAAIPSSMLLFLFLFAFLGAVSQAVYRLEVMHKLLRAALQCLIITVSAYICLFMPLQMNGNGTIIGLTATVMIYFICFGIGSFFNARFKALKEKEEQSKKNLKKQK